MIAENAVLGSILKEPYLIKEIDLQPEHLTSATNRNILTAMRKLDSEGRTIDLVSLLTLGSPEALGGAANLQQLQAVANPTKIDDHVEIVMDQWREREKINILNIATHENWNIDLITSKLSELTNDKTTDRHAIVDLSAEVFEKPWQKQESLQGVPTGLNVVDRMTGGWQKNDLIILAARPSMGKTDVMMNFAKHAGWHGKLPIIFSLEMPADKLRDRLISSIGRINKGKFKNLEKFLTDEEKSRWGDTLEKVNRTNLEIYDQAGQSLAEIRMKIRKSMNLYPDREPIILIDYLQLIRPADHLGGNRNLQVAEISKGLKEIAKEFNCPVICLSQLSRQVEQRNDKRPMMSDLRDSGSIEQDADVIIFLYRDAYYTKNDDDKELELLFAKHRNGETGMIKTYYDAAIGDVSM